MFSHVCKGLSYDDVELARGVVFQEIRSRAGLKTGDFVQERLKDYRRTALGLAASDVPVAGYCKYLFQYACLWRVPMPQGSEAQKQVQFDG